MSPEHEWRKEQSAPIDHSFARLSEQIHKGIIDGAGINNDIGSSSAVFIKSDDGGSGRHFYGSFGRAASAKRLESLDSKSNLFAMDDAESEDYDLIDQELMRFTEGLGEKE